MRKTKEDMLATREQILDAAFDCFYEKGPDATTLEEVAKRAGVTRGAIYWHFTDKVDLYRAVLDRVVKAGDVAAAGRELPTSLPFLERIEKTFWWALSDENRNVDFVYQALIYMSGKPEYADDYEKVKNNKRLLVDFFEGEVRIYVGINRLENINTREYAMELFLLFEGMFMTKYVPVGVDLSKEHIAKYIKISLNGLLTEEDR